MGLFGDFFDKYLTQENIRNINNKLESLQAKADKMQAEKNKEKQQKKEEIINRLYNSLKDKNNDTVEKIYVNGSKNHIYDGEDLAVIAAERVLRDRFYDDYRLNQVKYR
ncbi:hypothetical protein SAMN02745115_00358 [[Eubacterium] yurii]|jgi:hypothetical protein|nr:hypothetical protein SAMN02745115_00358 [[Eubacterium] yurii]